MTEAQQKDLLRAAANASLALGAIYDWVDKANKAGGATSISGVASCHAMLSSLNKNRPRLNKSVIDPLNAAIEAAQ